MDCRRLFTLGLKMCKAPPQHLRRSFCHAKPPQLVGPRTELPGVVAIGLKASSLANTTWWRMLVSPLTVMRYTLVFCGRRIKPRGPNNVVTYVS